LQLKIFLAGRVAVEADGRVIEERRFPGRQGRLMFAYLVAEQGRPVPRHELADALWGEAPPARWDKALTVIASKLRVLLGDAGIDGASALTGAFGCYRLVLPEGTWVDAIAAANVAREAQEALASGDLEAAKSAAALALSLARHPFLPGEDGSWVEEKRRGLADVRAEALSVLADSCLRSGEAAEAAKWAEEAVDLEPFRETGYRRLMEAHVAAGNRAEALRVYERCRLLLAEELGAYPSPETESIYQVALEGPSARVLAPPASEPRSPTDAQPVVSADGLSEDMAGSYPRRDEPIGALAPPAKAPRSVRSRRALLAVGAGALVLAVAAVAAVAALTESDGGRVLAPEGSGVAAIDPARPGVSAFVRSATPPSNLAVGEGAIWALNTEDATVSRIDPRTKAVTGRFRARALPSAVAAGAGALWIGNGGGQNGGNTLVSVSRVDPATLKVTGTVTLPNPGGGSGWFSNGLPQLAVGDGAVWAVDPDGSVARLDPRSGRVVATVAADVKTLGAGARGVWVLNGTRVARIDPRTNRLGTSVPIGASRAAGIAVGAGAVWVTADLEGLLWRIDPGPIPVTRTIDVGPGATFVAVGAGAVWVANFIAGTVSRIDPHTNRVTARLPIGAAQALAAGAGSAWVSTAGATGTHTLPASSCGAIETGGHTPDVLIASDLPLQGPSSAAPRAMADAIRLVLRQHGYRAGRFAVGYQSCDESTAQTGDFDVRRCAANAYAYARVKRLDAVIGPWSSFCAQVELPALDRAAGGSVPVISPTSTYAGLTRPGGLPPDAGGYRNEPGVYYPAGVRNFVRLLASDDRQGTALALLAKQLGLARVYVLHDGTDLWKGLVAEPFKRAANALRVPLAGERAFDPQATRFAALARAVARSGADGVVLGAWSDPGSVRLVKALRARLGPHAALMAAFGFNPPVAGARGVYVATTDVPRSALPLTHAGARFARDTGAGQTPLYGVLESAEATRLVLAAIANSDGTRSSVLEDLRASGVQGGILGSFRFDHNGDIDPPTVPILRLTDRSAPGAPVPGATVDRVVTIPAALHGP
jgi:DNA-binding SARP family transcriptional activator/ABC-type branched-subunit amino acid transport system substrate-binding protein/DNA-binding beta-propeller fold protein YncE